MQTENHNYAGGKVFIWISVYFFLNNAIKIFTITSEMLLWNGGNLNLFIAKKTSIYFWSAKKSGQNTVSFNSWLAPWKRINIWYSKEIGKNIEFSSIHNCRSNSCFLSTNNVHEAMEHWQSSHRLVHSKR